MKIYGWEEQARWAAERSPYYAELYRGVSGFKSLSDLPVVVQDDFWAANSVGNNRILTAPAADGIVFKSGGTTGNPKFSVFSREEWDFMVRAFGEGMAKAGLSAGDRIANLFYAGDLYGSFIFIMRAIESSPASVVQFPVEGRTPLETISKTIADFKINALAGPPTTLLNVADHLAQNRSRYPGAAIEKIFFGGESVYPDQRELLQSIFPGVKISSIGYASVDAGLLGYADSSCGPDEHRAFGDSVIPEIIDGDTGMPIEEPDRAGRLIVTSLTRRLMPIVRYPVGDLAVWKDPKRGAGRDRKFRILGRADDGARVGPVSVYYEDMRAVIAASGAPASAFQLVIRHEGMKDGLTVRIVKPAGNFDSDCAWKKIVERFDLERPAYRSAAERNLIHPLGVEWAAAEQIEINARTGKLRRVIDLRK